MILSVDNPHDVIYGSKFEIFFDGELQKLCLIADEGTGYIKRYKTNSRGEPFVEDNLDYLATEELFGEVSIVPID